MFDVGFWEVTLIAVVALLVIGPERLPGFARTVGLYVGKVRRYADHVRREIEREIPTQEIRNMVNNPPKPIADLQQTIDDTKSSLSKTQDELRGLGDELNQDATAAAGETPDAAPALREATPSESSGTEPQSTTIDETAVGEEVSPLAGNEVDESASRTDASR